MSAKPLACKEVFARLAEAVLLLGVGAIVLIVALAWFQPQIQGLLGARENVAELDRIRTELPIAKARWESLGIPDYDVDVSAFAHLGCYIDAATFSVRGGKLGTVTQHKYLGTPLPSPGATMPLDDDGGCPLDDLLIPAMFDRMEKTVDHVDPFGVFFRAEFDPEFGFVSEYRINYYGTDGIAHYTFSNFRPFLPSSPK